MKKALLFILFIQVSIAWAIKPPRFLYHWTTLEKAQIWNEQIQSNGGKFTIAEVPLELKTTNAPIVDLTLHQYLNTDLHNTPKIFAWHHPIGGMGFGSERYFGNGTPLLLTLEISPDARIFAIDNVGDGIARTWGELKNADLIFHGNESLSEWIIINPNVVKNYSALPTNFSKSTLQHYYKLLNNPSVKDVESLQLISLYSERSFLYESHGDARKALKQFMGLAKDDLPSLFRNSFPVSLRESRNTIYCPLYLEKFVTHQKLTNTMPAYLRK